MSALQQIPGRLFFRIGDVADILGVKPYVLRYWETEFPFIKPEKSNSGQRVYRRTDVEALAMIKHLLYEERYSIEGARKRARELRKEGLLAQYRAQIAQSVAVSVQDGTVRVEEVGENATESAATQRLDVSAANIIANSSPRDATESAGERPAFEISTSERVSPSKIREKALELQTLIATPLDSIFKY